MIYGLDLFSGIGGLTLALQEWVRPIAYCENDRYAQSVLLSRMRDGGLPAAPIWDDVRTLDGFNLRGRVDIISGGFPCQDISVAGFGAGLGGQRSGLFQHIARLIEETNPRFVFLENVPAIRTRGLNSVVQTFTELGYDCRWTIVSAAEVGARHLRKRWFLLAHAHSIRLRKKQRTQFERSNEVQRSIQSVSSLEKRLDTNDNGISKNLRQAKEWTHYEIVEQAVERNNWDEAASFFLGNDNGIQNRVDRHRALGNAVVPLQAKEAFKRLMGII